MPPSTRTTAHQATAWDRAAVALLGAAGCTLSYDSLQQIAIAIHIRPALTYLFPLVIDGFIAYGVRALLVLRTAPFRARLYIWTLFAAATTASVWANALHAVRLNQQTHITGLHLDDTTVGILSTIAPLALAGAVHLHILITRADNAPPATGAVTQPETVEHQHETPVGPEQEIQHTRPEPTPARHETAHPARRIGRPPSAELDELLILARPACQLHEIPTRAVVREAIRAAGHTISEDRLTQLIATLRRERDGH
ncbi:DUF2637 domain-containing protein [Actinacidiphila guanduensis]|uniref:DUF2637 domain-containing protein n=1 Tax=Actinacidiphila guanduensis TaxID=310781 RepID=A0A1G9YAC2_9ACTN|nr:DUF2637 domain-containing protein [Actinacidiphila guanduensis]SDN06002.1 Protein of unknown function [Actinacidiphila guanduensis]